MSDYKQITGYSVSIGSILLAFAVTALAAANFGHLAEGDSDA